MAQKTNFNISPYFDDYDNDKNFHKVLFTPGRSVQTRELNTIQSILQNQIESFGSHVFKEGTVVVPGEIFYDPSYNAVKINNVSFGVDVNLYIEKYEGQIIKGQVSGISAIVQKVVLPNNAGVDQITLYVKYLESGLDFNGGVFIDGESLLSTEAISYGINSTIIGSGAPFASLLSEDATDIGTAVSISEGIYYIRGNFVRVEKDTIILDYYTTNSSYRVGLNILEEVITAKEDNTLFDNAKGFTNFAAPGADRFKISTKLAKKDLTDFNDTNFVELLRVKGGVLNKIQQNTEYNKVRDYLAKRTYEESGNYVVDNFSISLNNSLNNLKGNNGKYFYGETTAENNQPSDDLMTVTLGPGKAYVNGYDIDKATSTVLDIEKSRDTVKVKGSQVPFTLGNVLRLNNLNGAITNKSVVSFYNGRRTGVNPTGGKVGEARAYLCKLTDAGYTGASTVWDLYLYDITLFAELTLNQSVTSDDIPAGTRIKGNSSGAIGYSVLSGDGSSNISVRVESGTFLKNESLHVGISTISRSTTEVLTFNQNDIKSVFGPTVSPASATFAADTFLDKSFPNGFGSGDTISIDSSLNVVSSKSLSGITTSTIIRYLEPGTNTERYNVFTSIGSDGLTATLGSTPADVTGVSLSSNPSSTVQVPFVIGTSKIRKPNSAYLYSVLPSNNVSSVELSNSRLSFSAQALNSSTITDRSTLELGVGAFSMYSDNTNVFFDTSKDIEKFSIHYTDGTIEPLEENQIEYADNNKTIKFNNINQTGSSKTLYLVNASFVKTGIQSKTKTHKKSQELDITLSNDQSSGSAEGVSLQDGLTYNANYGLRVQDDEICLRYPDVSRIIAVYESVDSNTPTLDSLSFSSLYSIDSTVIPGEDVYGKDSKAIARVVSVNSNVVTFVYYGRLTFNVGEEVTFTQSNFSALIQNIGFGSYKDKTKSYVLDGGQRDEYYDYSRLKLIKGQAKAKRRLKVIFDRYDVSDSNVGEVFSVLSYPEDSYQKDIPRIGSLSVRASDTLDFRPRVSYFSGSSSSPFDFSSRTTQLGSSPDVIFTPDESSLITYDNYLGRVDKIYLDPNGSFTIKKGVSSKIPIEPKLTEDNLHIATISLPPYLYDIGDARIRMVDNRRYTMRDIGKIEDRVETLERVTSLSLLESSAKSMQIQDSDGLERFKTGFFADSFNDASLVDFYNSLSSVENGELVPLQSNRSLETTPITQNVVSQVNYDTTVDYVLLDSAVKKTGNVVTLDYKESDWIEQPLATRIENVNPYHVIQYVGDIRLFPFRDIWIRTEQLENKILTHSLHLSLESEISTERMGLGRIDNTTGEGSAGLGVGGVRDTWTTLHLNDVTENTEVTTSKDTDRDSTFETAFVEQVTDEYMRSRNTEFSSSNLKAFTEYYAFLDGESGIKVIPKLIEIAKENTLETSGSTNSFQVGEVITVESGGKIIMNCRLANANHKAGLYNDPTLTYTTNPYNRDEQAQELYSTQSQYLNIDTRSLAEKSPDGDVNDKDTFIGYIEKGAKIVGNTSNAVAYVKDIRLITDNFGDIIGSFFVDDPNTAGEVKRFATGEKTFKLSSTKNAANALIVGSTDYSSAETTYVSEGSVNKLQNVERVIEAGATLTTKNNVRTKQLVAIRNENISTTEVPTPVTVNNITQIIQRQGHADPLAQTFLVGTARGLNSGWTEDSNGAFLTAVDIFFNKVDSGSAPITVQLRTCEFGIPTLSIIGDPVTLRPDEIKVSADASVATKVTFPYPIYLPADLEYAIVLMAPESEEYEVWTAKMSEKTINTTSLPDVESVRYTRQFALGSLFKSQNGSTWTPDQSQDLKFKLYKAEFSSLSGKLYLGNNNTKRRHLLANPIRTLPKKVKVRLDSPLTTSSDVSALSVGTKVTVAPSEANGGFGFIVGTGSTVHAIGLQTGGQNYKQGTYTAVDTIALTGGGTNLKLDLTVGSDGTIPSTVAINASNVGNGYSVGDVITVDSNSMGSSGSGARITITSNNNSIDTLFLTNVQGENFGTGEVIKYYTGSSSVAVSNGGQVNSVTIDGDYNDGNYFQVNHFSHGMYATNNRVELSGVSPDTPKIKLTSSLSSSDGSLNILNSNIQYFTKFEGVDVGAANFGYLKINDEIIKYTSAPSNGTSIGGPLQRGQLGTIASSHPEGSIIQKYEVSGVSLARINTKFDIEDTGIDLDSYYLKIERGGVNSIDLSIIGRGRGTDSTNQPQLSFNSESSVGGFDARATENYVYDRINCICDAIIPNAGTTIDGRVRTISGTSCNGSETSFLDLGYEEVNLNSIKKLSSLRMAASQINQDEYLSSIPRNKSVTTEFTLSSNNYNVSPMIFLDDTKVILMSSRLNNPVSDYTNNLDVRTLAYDPHEASYVSKLIKLSQPSSSLKVIVSAYRHDSADFRVLYQLIKQESNASSNVFELFPGYDNLTTDLDGDGYYDVVDPSKNSGRPDRFVPSSLDNQFVDYEFTAPNIGPYIGYRIKIVMSGTQMDKYPRFKDLRVISLA